MLGWRLTLLTPTERTTMKMTLPKALLSALFLTATLVAKMPYEVVGVYTETCACRAPCACELTGDVPAHCAGGGAIQITKGSYGGADMSGVSIGYATKPGAWVRLYIQAPDAARRATAELFARAVYGGFGKIESVADAKISIMGGNGNYHVTVDGGATADYTIAQVLGGDGASAVAHGNTHNAFTSTFLQAKADGKAVFHAGSEVIEVESGRNGYFNDKMNKRGEI